jgi:O-antigen/teichoic acid export membrane protein
MRDPTHSQEGIVPATGHRGRFVRLLGGSVLNQALLSAGNFAIGLMLVRLTTDADYGYYILITTALLLFSSVQSAYIQPSMISRLQADNAPRRAIVGGIYREQRQWLLILAACGFGVIAVLWLAGIERAGQTIVASCGILAGVAMMYRELFRMVLQADRLPYVVLRADVVYVALLVVGTVIATMTPAPGAATALAIAIAAACGGTVAKHSLWKYEPWDIHGSPGILREFATFGGWASLIVVFHWSFTQGYGYVVASVLDVKAVAAVAATRLMLMPLVIFSMGLSTLMLPTATDWVKHHGVGGALRRLLMTATGLVTLASCYVVVLWLLRDMVFVHVLKRQFAQQDDLLLFWSFNFVLILFRDQICFLLIARGRFKIMAVLTGACGILSLAVMYWSLQHIGVMGAPLGVLVGESANLIGIAVLIVRELRTSKPQAPAAPLAAQASPGVN